MTNTRQIPVELLERAIEAAETCRSELDTHGTDFDIAEADLLIADLEAVKAVEVSESEFRIPQRFRVSYKHKPGWTFGYCYPIDCDQWQICVESGSGFASFDDDPWEILGQIIGGDVESFQWIDNDCGWIE